MPTSPAPRPPRAARTLAALAMLVVTAGALAACGPSTTADPSQQLRVVATTSILGDLAANAVDGVAQVQELIPTGADPHAFEPSAAQIGALRDADLIVANGLGLEEGLADALSAAEQDGAALLRLAERLRPRPATGAGAPPDATAEDTEDHGAMDPHVWLDPVRMADAVPMIAEHLGRAAPAVAGAADEQAGAYRTELLELHRSVQRTLDAVPPERRTLVTDHDALGYLADRYGFTIAGVIVPGGSTLAAPSSRQLTALVDTLRTARVRAIFTDTTGSSRLAQAVGAELEAPVEVVELHIGSLGGPGSGAETYVEMMHLNARRIAEALTG